LRPGTTRLLLRLFLSWSFVVYIVVDIYVWVARMADPPLVGFYAVAATWPDFWLTFHAFLVACLVAGLTEAILVSRQLLRG
jgi:hypothetical protein